MKYFHWIIHIDWQRLQHIVIQLVLNSFSFITRNISIEKLDSEAIQNSQLPRNTWRCKSLFSKTNQYFSLRIWQKKWQKKSNSCIKCNACMIATNQHLNFCIKLFKIEQNSNITNTKMNQSTYTKIHLVLNGECFHKAQVVAHHRNVFKWKSMERNQTKSHKRANWFQGKISI